VKAKAPLKVLGRVGLWAKGRVNGDLSGEAASVRQPHGVDEQISMLLESLDVELSETGLSRPASRPPNSKRLRPVRSFTSNRRSRRSIASRRRLRGHVAALS